MTSPYKTLRNFAATQPAGADPGPETGFFENIGPGFDETRKTGLSTSQYNAVDEIGYNLLGRNQQIVGMIQDGVFPDDITSKYGDPRDPYSGIPDFEGYAAFANEELGYDQIRTWASLTEEAAVSTNEALVDINELQSRQTTGGFWGEMLGMTGAYFTDPLTAISVLLTPAAVLRSATIGGAIVRAGLVSGASVGLEEAARQPMVQSWRKDLGMEYGWGPALQDIGFATGGGLVIGGAAGGSFKALQKIFSKNPDDHLVAQFINDMSEAPDPNMPAAQHMENIDTAVKNLSETSPALALGDVVDNVDPIYAASREAELPEPARKMMDEWEEEIKVMDAKEKQYDTFAACLAKGG